MFIMPPQYTTDQNEIYPFKENVVKQVAFWVEFKCSKQNPRIGRMWVASVWFDASE